MKEKDCNREKEKETKSVKIYFDQHCLCTMKYKKDSKLEEH